MTPRASKGAAKRVGLGEQLDSNSSVPLGGQLDAAPRRSGPSGPTIPEAERRARGTEQLKVRVRTGYRDRLRRLAESDGYTMGEWIEAWIEMAERGEHVNASASNPSRMPGREPRSRP